MKLIGGIIFIVGVFLVLAGLLTVRGTFEQTGLGILCCAGGILIGSLGTRKGKS